MKGKLSHIVKSRRRVAAVILAVIFLVIWSLFNEIFGSYRGIGCHLLKSTKVDDEVTKSGKKEDIETNASKDKNRSKRVLAFVGVQTGFGSRNRRNSLRQTWFPTTASDIQKWVFSQFTLCPQC